MAKYKARSEYDWRSKAPDGQRPDIYMGAAYQTARKLIDDGMIGIPLIAYAM